jgi:hypothetical protein
MSIGASLPPARDILDDRLHLTDDWDSAESALAVSQFPLLTIRSALRLRSEDPTVFSYDATEITPDAYEVLQTIVRPPLVLTPTGLNTYGSVNPDKLNHLPLIAWSFARLAVEQLAYGSDLNVVGKFSTAVRSDYGRDVFGVFRSLVRMFIGCLDDCLEGKRVYVV